ncbi:hypothetical protein [Streptomyces sp. NPDC003952]
MTDDSEDNGRDSIQFSANIIPTFVTDEVEVTGVESALPPQGDEHLVEQSED